MKPDAYTFFIGSAIFYRFCWALMTTLSMVYMYVVAGLDPLQMVLVGTVLELSCFVLEIPTGVVADTYSRKTSMIIGYITMGIGFGLIAIWPTFEVILLSQIVWGAGATFLSGASQAWITEEVGESQANHGFVVAGQWGSAGALVGIALCVTLGTINMALPILIGSLGLAALGIAAIWLMQETNFHPTREADRETWHHLTTTFRSGVRLVRATPMLALILIIALLEGLNREGFDRLYAPHLIDTHTFPELFGATSLSWWGLLAAGSTVFAFLALSQVRRRVKTDDMPEVIKVLSWANLALLLSTIAFLWAGSLIAAVFAYYAVTTLRAVIGPLTTAWLNQNLEASSRATLFSMHAQMRALGEMTSGPVIGAIGKFIAVKIAVLTSALVILPILLMYRKATGHLREGTKGGGE